jgi:GNAT superfamily N-acetyltransferase
MMALTSEAGRSKPMPPSQGPGSSIEVQPEPLDGPVAAHLARRLIEELDRRYPEQENGGPLDPTEVVPPTGIFLVARLDGEPAGCGALRRLDDGVTEVKRMYVEPWARGHGVARRLLAGLEQAALRLGYAAIRLETDIRQPEAIGLYESSGYRRISAYGEYVDSPLNVCFEKALTRP